MTSRHLAALQKSTIVRSFSLLEQLAPSAGARWAETLWFSVPRTRGQRARQVRAGCQQPHLRQAQRLRRDRPGQQPTRVHHQQLHPRNPPGGP